MHLLFVCTGNICRSPTAERLAFAVNNQDPVTDFRVSSAGTRALIGYPLHPEAARVLTALGGDPADFTARRLSTAIASEADLVLTMTKQHRDEVLELAPRQLHRTFTLAEAAELVTQFRPSDIRELAPLRPRLHANQTPDVLDPIGQSPEVFQRVGVQIAELIEPIIDFCRRVSQNSPPSF